MAISFVNKGSFAAVVDTNTSSPTIPASMQAGDFMVLVVETEGASISVSAGWTLAGSQLNRGTANNAGGVRLAVYTRAWVSGDAAPTVTTTGAGHAVSMIFGFRGVDTTTPLDGVSPTTTSQAASTTLTMPGITTATGNAVVVHCMALDRDFASSNTVTGNPTNANLTFTGFGTSGELHDQIVADRRGGGIFVAAGLNVVAGATGNTTATQASSAYLGITLSLRAAVTDSGSASVTLSAFTLAGSGAQSFAGAASVTLGAFTLGGVGAQSFAGVGAVTLGAFSVSGTGASGTNGSASVTLNAFALGGVGAQSFAGAAGVTLNNFTLTGTGAQSFAGVGAVTLDAFTLGATGAQSGVNATVGTLGATLGAFTLGATGVNSFTGAGAVTLGAFALVGVGAQSFAGVGAVTLESFTLAGSGVNSFGGVGSPTLGAFTLAGTGEQTVASATTGTAGVTLDAFTLSSSATGASADLGGAPVQRLRRWRRRADPLPDPTAESDDPNDYRKFEPGYGVRQPEPVEDPPAPAPVKLTKGFLSRLAVAGKSEQLGVMLQLTDEAILSGDGAKVDRLNTALTALDIETIARRIEKHRRQVELLALRQELFAEQQKIAAQAAKARRLEDEEDELLLLMAA